MHELRRTIARGVILLALNEIWLAGGGAAALAVCVALWLLLRKGGSDYSINRHEEPSPFDFAQQQRELEKERARIDRARREAESQARTMAAQAGAALQEAADHEGDELKAMARDAEALTAEREAIIAANEAQAQAAIRLQQQEAAALIRKQEQEIARVKAEQEREIALRKAEFERAREAHFNVLKRYEPPPATVSYALSSPVQDMADVMQASYAQIVWAFAALARKLDHEF